MLISIPDQFKANLSLRILGSTSDRYSDYGTNVRWIPIRRRPEYFVYWHTKPIVRWWVFIYWISFILYCEGGQAFSGIWNQAKIGLEFWNLDKNDLEFWNFQFVGIWNYAKWAGIFWKMTWNFGIFILLESGILQINLEFQ